MTDTGQARRDHQDEAGYTLVEMLIAMFILMTISGVMLQGVLDMRRLNDQQANRSAMHAGIRNATALLQQEVGQAGRVAFPADVTLSDPVTAQGDQWVTVSPSVAGMFDGEFLIVGVNEAQEVVEVVGVDATSNQIRADFFNMHDAGAPVTPAGGFAEGVIPTTRTNGSSASVLKIVGDINSDGNLVYVEYTCDWNDGRLFRNMVPFDAAAKPELTVEQVLLDNLLPNPPDPDGTVPACFTYEERIITGRTYVINVAIMTTVRTHDPDPITGQFMTVTKALLNVAPRNVFHIWQMASLGYANRIQPLPQSVVQLLE